MRYILWFLIVSFSWQITFSQTNKELYILEIKETIDQIQIDGNLKEAGWREAKIASDFWEKSPRDDHKASVRTEVKVTYDPHFLYVAFICHDTSSKHIVQTLKRDESFWDNDGVAIILDPINEATNGFFFATNTAGAQNEALIAGGTGNGNYSDEWDNKWFVETSQNDGFWVAEFAIPFKTLRYDSKNQTWGINFTRLDSKRNEMHIWAQIPRQFWPIDLGYAGRLIWDKPPPKTKGNISIIPYLSTGFNQVNEEDGNTNTNFSAGIDAKVALSSSLNLDLTINPDFSQVEVDAQVTNLTRFSIFFPERRNFFLENSDLFSRFGNPIVRPFFSRRIGLNNDGEPIPIQMGVRLSGNVNDNLRIGIMDVHTGKKGMDTNAQNYFTAAFSQRIFKRSKVEGILINRQGFERSKHVDQDFGRNAGLQFTYQSQDGRWTSWSSYHLSMKPGISSENTYLSLGGEYSGKVFSTTVDLVSIGTNYYADVGFVNRIFQYDAINDVEIRQGFKFIYWPARITLVPKQKSRYQEISFEVEHFVLFNPDYTTMESNHEFVFETEFTNSSSVGFGVSYTDLTLQYPFSFSDSNPLPAGQYNYVNYGLEYQSDERKLLNYEVGLKTGTFYNGTIRNAEFDLNYRRQPWGQFSLSAEFNHVQFPDEYGSSKLWLVGPKFELSFSRNLFWSTFIQYNTQADNFNINSRFQWQFQPLSWVYLVYTDNYITTNWIRKNRALIFKINYWLGI